MEKENPASPSPLTLNHQKKKKTKKDEGNYWTKGKNTQHILHIKILGY